MSETINKNRIAANTVYTMGGTFLLNGVLQLIIYPLLNRRMGSEPLGVLLYIMGLAAIICPSAGQALNTSRLVVRRDYKVENGDYDILLLIFGGLGTAAALFLSAKYLDSPATVFWIILLLMTTSFRYYGEVEYRLSLNYRNYFNYYFVLTIGYLAGFCIYLLTKNWFWVFVTGESAALVYVSLTGTVFKNFLKKSSCFGIACRRGVFLAVSYLVTNLTLNIDRIVLEYLIGSLAVTRYYVTSLIGKTLVLLAAPVNTIIISYLTREDGRMGRKRFLKFTGAGIAVSLVFFAAAQLVTPLFIKILYGDLYESVKNMITIVNLSQILGVLSAYLFIVVLTFTEEKWQMILQIFHLAVILLLVLVITPKGGILGFSWAVLIANLIRVAAVTILGITVSGKNRKE